MNESTPAAWPHPAPLVCNATLPSPSPPDRAADLSQHCPLFTLLLNTVVMGLLCVLGLTGNTVSILVLQKDRHNRVAVFLLQALALADNTVLLLSLLILSLLYGLFPALGLGTVAQAMSPAIIRYINPLGYVAQSCVIWITVLLALNRYVAVCRPFSAQRLLSMPGARLQVAAVVLVSVIMNIPRCFQQFDRRKCPTNSSASLAPGTTDTSLSLDTITTMSLETAHPSLAARCNASAALGAQNCTDTSDIWFEVVYLNAVYTSVMLVLPLVLLVGLNVPLIRQIQGSKRRMQESSLSYRGSAEDNITVVMTTIVLVMLVCHAPDRIVAVVRFLSDDQEIHCPRPLFYAQNFANLLVMTNSSTDFLIYYIFRRRFRSILWAKMRCLCGRGARGEGERVSMIGGEMSTRDVEMSERHRSGRVLGTPVSPPDTPWEPLVEESPRGRGAPRVAAPGRATTVRNGVDPRSSERQDRVSRGMTVL